MDLTLNVGIDHVFWPTTIWARHMGCCAKQAADQRTLLVHRATIWTQMYTPQVSQSLIMFGIGFHRQTRYFFRRRRYWAAAVMTARLTFKRWNTLSQTRDNISISINFAYFLNHSPALFSIPNSLDADFHAVPPQKSIAANYKDLGTRFLGPSLDNHGETTINL